MARQMTVERAEKIQLAWASYKGLSKAALQARVKASRRIVDVSGCDKQSLISMLVTAEYGVSDTELAFTYYWRKAVREEQVKRACQ